MNTFSKAKKHNIRLKEVMTFFDVKIGAVNHWVKRGLTRLPDSTYNMHEVCCFVKDFPMGKRTSDTSKKLDVRKKAREYLKQNGLVNIKCDYIKENRSVKADAYKDMPVNAEDLDLEDEDDEPLDIRKVTYKKVKSKYDESELGIAKAVDRLRRAEFDTHALFRQAFKERKAVAISASLKTYQEVMDLLRKSENDLLKVLKDQQVVITFDDAKQWIMNEVDKVKKAILGIANKLSPQLENKPYHEIQEMLKEECVDICKMFTEFGSAESSVQVRKTENVDSSDEE